MTEIVIFIHTKVLFFAYNGLYCKQRLRLGGHYYHCIIIIKFKKDTAL